MSESKESAGEQDRVLASSSSSVLIDRSIGFSCSGRLDNDPGVIFPDADSFVEPGVILPVTDAAAAAAADIRSA